MSLTSTSSIAPRRRPLRDSAHRRSERPARRTGARRRIDAPRDSALYTCHCGAAWNGAVTTSVACPACGAAQAW